MQDFLKLTAAVIVAGGLTLTACAQEDEPTTSPAPATGEAANGSAKPAPTASDSADGATAPEQAAPGKVDLEIISYIQGFQAAGQLAAQFKQVGYDVNPASFTEGAQAALEGGEPKYTEEQLQTAFATLQADVTQKRDKAMAAEKERFAQQMADTSAYQTTDSGLQYTVIQEGQGESPTAQSVVVVNYTGRLEDGTVFDSTSMRGQPAQFPVAGVVPGFGEALQMMKPGGKLRAIIPGDLAYGQAGEPRAGIGPNATLVFDIELLGELPPQGQQPGQPVSDLEYQAPAEDGM